MENNKLCYLEMKNNKSNLLHEQSRTNDKSIEEKAIDDSLESYLESIEESAINCDKVDMFMRRIDCLNTKGKSLYESSILESFLPSIRETEFSYRKIVPYITPYFTLKEYLKMFPDTDKNMFQYVIENDQKEYFHEIRDLQKEYNESHNEKIIDRLLELGWNPMIPINGESIKSARERQIDYLDNHAVKITEIADISEFNTNISEEFINESDIINNAVEPVYIVLSYTSTAFGKVIKAYQKCTYTHAMLSLDHTLKKLYSYNLQPNIKVNGFQIDSIDAYKNTDFNLKVICFFVTKETKKKLKEVIRWFEDHVEQTSYSIMSIVNIVFNKTTDTLYDTAMVCSQFVDSVLKMCNIDITHVPSNLATPRTFEKLETGEKSKLFCVFEGMKSKYNPSVVKRKVMALLKSPKKIVYNEDTISTLFEYKIENLRLYNMADKEMNKIFQEFNEYITPEAIIGEVSMPVKFTKQGDLIIVKKEDLQTEYNEAHKLLSMYDETNIEGIKHELAKLFYLNSIIEKKLKKMKNSNNSEYKELIDLRARILNDFSTYFKIVKTVEPHFDFTEYIKHSEYYNKTIKIDNYTLKYSGRLIKDFLSQF